MLDKLNRLRAKSLERLQAPRDSPPGWRESAHICALADAERHLGHAIRAGKFWIAYDAIHPHPTSDGFRLIGTFATIAAAKDAVEESVGIARAWAAGVGIMPDQFPH